jgi:exopolysaccharide biosynthesis polyprenyl glycosylphosphotransferase
MALRLAVLGAMAVFAAVWVAAPLEPAAPSHWPSLTGALLPALALVLALREAACAWMARPKRVERILLLGGGALADQLVEAIESRPDRRRVLGIVDDGGARSSDLGLGTLSDLDRIVEGLRPDRVVVALASRRGQMPFKTLLRLRVDGIAVEDGVDCYERLTGKVPIEALRPTSLIFGKDVPPGRVGLATAWALNRPLAGMGLVLLAPLLTLIALAIKLDSRGPVLFVQPRVGRGGRSFRLIKFRTMRPASGMTSEWVRDNHGRLTRVGRWLRRFRLDELPQLVNVAMGDMNLVGPRPHPVSNLSLLALVARNTPECGEQIPFYALRSLVRPGLTGWAQVRYRYANDLEEEIEKMRYDLYYIKHRSLWLDLRILLETVKIVIHGRESTDQVEPVGAPEVPVQPSVAPSRRADAIDPLAAPPAPVAATPLAPSVPMGSIAIARPDGRGTARA